MAVNAPILFQFAGLPESYCFTTPSRFALDIVNAMQGYLQGQYTLIIDSETEPAPEDRGKLWHKLLPGGVPTGQIYKYFGGFWVTQFDPHGTVSGKRVWYEGLEATVGDIDGGTAADPVTDFTGPFWEVDHNYDFRFPLGAGTSPAPASTTAGPGDTGGAEQATMDATTMHPHTHDFGTESAGSIESSDEDGKLRSAGTNYFTTSESTTHVARTRSVGGSGTPAAAQPFDIMPPYRAGFWIKRTARIWILG